MVVVVAAVSLAVAVVIYLYGILSQNSSVGIMMGYGL